MIKGGTLPIATDIHNNDKGGTLPIATDRLIMIKGILPIATDRDL